MVRIHTALRQKQAGEAVAIFRAARYDDAPSALRKDRLVKCHPSDNATFSLRLYIKIRAWAFPV